jgi:hypothetical protein
MKNATMSCACCWRAARQWRYFCMPQHHQEPSGSRSRDLMTAWQQQTARTSRDPISQQISARDLLWRSCTAKKTDERSRTVVGMASCWHGRYHHRAWARDPARDPGPGTRASGVGPGPVGPGPVRTVLRTYLLKYINCSYNICPRSPPPNSNA